MLRLFSEPGHRSRINVTRIQNRSAKASDTAEAFGPAPPTSTSNTHVTGTLTQIFEEGQRQDDPDGHKYHQVVPVQVPFAAGESEGVRAGPLIRVCVRVCVSVRVSVRVFRNVRSPRVFLQSQEGPDHFRKLILDDEQVAGHG